MKDGRIVVSVIGFLFLTSVDNIRVCRKKGILFVAIDQNRPLSEQGPFDILLHKVRFVRAHLLSLINQSEEIDFEEIFSENGLSCILTAPLSDFVRVVGLAAIG